VSSHVQRPTVRRSSPRKGGSLRKRVSPTDRQPRLTP